MMMALPFSVNENGAIMLSEDEPTSVQPDSSFVEVNESKGVQDMPDEITMMTSVDAVLASPYVDEPTKKVIRANRDFQAAETARLEAERNDRIDKLAANVHCTVTKPVLQAMNDEGIAAVEAMVAQLEEASQPQQRVVNSGLHAVPQLNQPVTQGQPLQANVDGGSRKYVDPYRQQATG